MRRIINILLLTLALSVKIFAQTTPSFVIESVDYEVKNLTFNGMKGMVFYLEMDVKHYLNKHARVKAVLEYKDDNGNWVGVPHSNKISGYRNQEGTVRAISKTYLDCIYEDSYWKKLEVFLPYEAITHPKGSVQYRIGFFLANEENPSQFIKNENGSYYHYYTFGLSWPQANYASTSHSSSNSYSSSSSNSTSSYSSSSSSSRSYSSRQDLPGGGYIEYTQQADGRMMMTTVMPCTVCHGSKVCTACWGQGGRWGAAYGGTWYPCYLCAGTGQNRCMVCNGTGKVTTITFSDGNGNAYGVSSNGSTSVSNSAGTIVTTPYGTKTYSNGSGGSSSGSSSSGSSSRSTDNDYIEEIVYAPNYSGSDTRVWCDKCKKWGARHSHIKKRIR